MARSEDVCKGWLEKGMCGVLPVYDEHGANISLILFEGESSVYEPHRVKTVVNRLAKLFYMDINLIKGKAHEITGQRTGNALPISRDLVLIPFKTRKPIGRDDGSLGYIFKSSIDKIDETDAGVYLYLKDGQAIPILERPTTARRRIAMADHIVDKMLDTRIGGLTSDSMLRDTVHIYNEPVTKGDIYLFLSHFLEKVNDKKD